jgi:hypothetical protein
MGYIRRDISLGCDRVEPEACQCTALVIRARAEGIAVLLRASPCSVHGGSALRF